MAKSSLSGVPRLRRTLRSLPDHIHTGVSVQVIGSARLVLDEMDRSAPHDSIRENLSIKLSSDGLTARVGLIGKRAARRGFLGRIFEFGAKAHVIMVRAFSGRRRGRRGKPKRSLVSVDGVFLGKKVQHPGMKARPWFFVSLARHRPEITRRLKNAVGQALEKASRGV